MSELKYKVGNKVRIKSIDWYNKNKDEIGVVKCGDYIFTYPMTKHCGKTVTITYVNTKNCYYVISEDDGFRSWTDEMIEGLSEEEIKFGTASNPIEIKSNANCLTQERADEKVTKIDKELLSGNQNVWELPDGYQFKDENGNVINATKIVLEKVNTLKIQSDNMETETHRGYCTTEEETTNKSKKVAWFSFLDNNFADKVELDLSNRELIQEDGKWFVVKKESPKTYEECCKVLDIPSYYKLKYSTFEHGYNEYTTSKKLCLLQDKLNTLGKLLICRNAYWKLYGEGMGLGEPWEPDWNSCEDKFCITIFKNKQMIDDSQYVSRILVFPTEKMRDTFKANFDKDIEFCKELL